jgi:hypothetical protein
MDWLNKWARNIRRPKGRRLGPERPPYQYEPLPNGRWFRILRLLPGQPGDPIRCELDIFAFDDAPAYEPVSYAWGNTALSEEITCGGKQLFITRSLLKALRRFRYERDVRLIWVDAICINQKNKDEQGHQVGFMQEIYTGGSCTLIWLGEDRKHKGCIAGRHDCANMAIHVMRSVNAYFHQQLGHVDVSDHETIWERIHEIKAFPKDHELASSSKLWRCVQHFFSRAWFTRLWYELSLQIDFMTSVEVHRRCT